MADLLIVKNIEREGPGAFGEVAERSGIGTEVIEAGGTLPDPRGYRAMVVLGGPASANESTPTMHAELARVAEAVAAGIPYLGICLGLQVLVKAAGGSVIENPVEEVGFTDPGGEPYQVELTAEGRADPLLAGLPSTIPVFQLHGETVEPADGMSVLATGRHCHVQVLRAGSCAYGIQGHVELTERMLDRWAREDPSLRPLGPERLASQFAEVADVHRRTAEQIFENFLQIAGLDHHQDRP